MPFQFVSKKNQPDEVLLDKFRETGDTEWLGELFGRYMHLVYGVCLKYLKDRDQAQDSVIEIFEKLVVEVPAKEIHNFKPWLYVVTKNHCLMALRHQKSINNRESAYKNDQLSFMENSLDWHPYDGNGDEKLEERLAECLKKLKADQKNCIELFYLKKLCYQQISKDLNLDIKKVKSFIQNGKRNLKICLESIHEA